MFDIEYKGANCVVISTKTTEIVFDPKLSLAGLKDYPIKGGIEVATEARFATNDENAKLHIEGPGEYESGDVSIKGIRATRHLDTADAEPISTIYRIEIGDVRIGVMGNIAPKLSDDQLEGMGVIDILILPVGGGGYTLDATSASVITRQVDPHVVVPVHFADTKVTYEVPQDGVDVFIKELAAPVDDEVQKYKVKSSSSIPQTLSIVRIARS